MHEFLCLYTILICNGYANRYVGNFTFDMLILCIRKWRYVEIGERFVNIYVIPHVFLFFLPDALALCRQLQVDFCLNILGGEKLKPFYVA